MMIRFKIPCASLLVLLCYSGMPGAATPVDDSQKPVQKVFAALAAAYNARDSKAVVELFTPTGEFIDGEENIFQGREAISREFDALFENNPKSAIVLDLDDTREISPGLLTVDATARVSDEDSSDSREIGFVALLVRQTDGRWLLASIRSLGDEDEETPHAQLMRLEWLIGEWVDESSESTMHFTSRWSGDGNFIITDFSLKVAGSSLMTGTQRIGWNASLGKFKSWVFDSEGGFAEGLWTDLDDRWVVHASGVRPDGDVGSATHIYEPKSPDSFLFSVVDRIVGDEAQPDFTSRVVRKPPEPAKSAASMPRAN